MVLAAVGLVTLPKVTVCEPEGSVELLASDRRRWPAVASLTVQPDAAPRPVGCEARVAELFTAGI